jgi:Universal stress protein family
VRSLVDVGDQHILVAYDGTSDGDAALLAASELARRDGARLTIVTVVALERPIRRVTRLPMLTSVCNDVLLDRARADLERAGRLRDNPPNARCCSVLRLRRSRPALRSSAATQSCSQPGGAGGLRSCWTLTAHGGCSATPRYRSCARVDGRARWPGTLSCLPGNAS